MQANPRTITALFEPTHRYVVPMFQRHYVWSCDEHWEPLWNDIEEKLITRQQGKRTSPHFLGAVILDSARRTSTKQVSRFILIDGQQRLTTFQILLTALRDAANSRYLPHVARAAERCLLNPDVALMERPEEEQYKLWPTLVNRSAFCQIVTAGSPQRVRELFPIIRLYRKRKPEPREKLAEAYEFFFDKLKDICSTCESSEAANDLLITVLGVLRDDFTVVEIILGENDDSQEIFNSLNARGKPLSQSDLLRSYIFMRAEKNETDRDHLYENYWSHFENTWWDEETRRGSQTSSRLDTLTRTLLSSKLGSSIDVRRVHSSYTGWIENDAPYKNLQDELHEFKTYGVYFQQLNGKTDGPLSMFGHRMQKWETTTVFPLAIYLAAETLLSPQELSEAFTLIESFVVRRAVCGLQNKEYNKFFIEVIARLRKASTTVQALREILSASESETRRFPTDTEFASAWRTEPLYNRLKSGQLTLIFRQLEAEMRSNRAEATPIPYVSVEHIMPQEWTESYQLAGES
ncbi:MAG TPA: DUF262 domain-containing protein, partial [Candidatus Saccharimonadales bacterium]|nr:DUF262 domain-containing protein [Candidatus Saccharimonadales bacterium]